MTDQEKIKALTEALEEIVEYDVYHQHGCIDEWEEAEAFHNCQNTAKEVLQKIKTN